VRLSGYFKEMAAFSLLSREEEESAFMALERAETKLLLELFSRPSAVMSASAVASGNDESPAFEQMKAAFAAFKPGDRRSLESLVASVVGARAVAKVMDVTADEVSSLSEAQEDPAGRRWSARVRLAASSVSSKKNRIVVANLRLVVMFAHRYSTHGTSMTSSDLIQEGNMGLMRAVEKFDRGRDVRFSTYAVWWIRQAMKRGLADLDRIVRIPVHMSEASSKLVRLERVHFAKTGEKLDDKEAAEALGITEDKVRLIRQARMKHSFSLDAPVTELDEAQPFVSFLPDPSAESPSEELWKKELSNDLDVLLTVLTPIESRIIRWRFALGGSEPLTLQQIADKYDLSRERIRQLEARALKKLKDRSRLVLEHSGSE